MARMVIGFAVAYSNYSVHMAAMRGYRRTALHQYKAGKKQQGQHDVVEIPVVQSPVGPRAEPRADQRTRQRQQRQPETSFDEAAGDLHAECGAKHGAVEDRGAAPLILGPAPHARPQGRKRPRQAGESAKDAARKSDRGVRRPTAERNAIGVRMK